MAMATTSTFIASRGAYPPRAPPKPSLLAKAQTWLEKRAALRKAPKAYAQNHESPFHQLPSELIVKIIRYSDPGDIVTTARTCRRVKFLVDGRFFNRGDLLKYKFRRNRELWVVDEALRQDQPSMEISAPIPEEPVHICFTKWEAMQAGFLRKEEGNWYRMKDLNRASQVLLGT